VIGTTKRHIQELKAAADAQQWISQWSGGEGSDSRPSQDFAFVIGQFERYLPVS